MKIEEKIRNIREIKGISQETVATHLAIIEDRFDKIVVIMLALIFLAILLKNIFG